MRASLLVFAAALAVPARAHAFCGFYVGGAGAKLYNHATEVVLMRQGTTTVISMANNYQGPPQAFAMVVPVPTVLKKAQVKTLPRDIFDKVDTLGAPRLVEYWEQDPCQPSPPEAMPAPPAPDVEDDARADGAPSGSYHVKVEARFSVGEYDIEVLSATESTGLDRWLRDHHYAIPDGAEPLLRPYIEQGMKWFVAKVDPKKVAFDPQTHMATLSPLRFYYDSPDFTLPIRLGLANSSGTQDLIVNILAPGDTRYAAANYPNVTIPTNLQVTDAARDHFGEFYAALFDATMAKHPHAVVTEYAWSASNCDPCPGPTLDDDDLATLGADVLGQTDGGADFTLTRLHARYGKEIDNDLVFTAVDPLEGGRGIPEANGDMADVPTPHAPTNNFQGRYVILHPWKGPIACQAPVRGRWGDPPDGANDEPQAAKQTAFAPRGRVQLASLLTRPVSDLDVVATAPGETSTTTSSLGLGSQKLRQPVGCGGCGTGAGGGGATLGAIGLVGLALRRRRR